MVVIEPTGSACGALVKGINLNKPISTTLKEKLVWALNQHRYLVIKKKILPRKVTISLHLNEVNLSNMHYLI